MKNNFLNLHEVFLIVSIIESLFLSAFFKLMPSAQKQARSILAFFFLLVAGTLASTLVIWNSYLQTLPIADSIVAPLVVSACLLLQGPTLFCYLRSLSHRINLWQWQNLIHLVPALLAVTVIAVFQVTVQDWLPWQWTSIPAHQYAVVRFVWALVKCAPLIYVLACFYAEYRLRREMKNHYSSISSRELLAADIVLGGFFIHWLWSFVGYFLGGYLSGEANDLVGTLNNYLTAILLNTLFIFGLLNTRQLLNVAPVEEGDTKPAEASLPEEKIAAIEKGITDKKLYLESNINLERFAEQVGLKPRDVSTIINAHYHSNFFEFINGYRVEEAKRLLLAKDSRDTVLDIIYKSGFNSQSAFHRFFKRIAGVTPSEYRNQHRANLQEQKG